MTTQGAQTPLETQTPEQQQESSATLLQQPVIAQDSTAPQTPKHAFDPENLTEEDFACFSKWHFLDKLEEDQLDEKLEEAQQAYSSGQFWIAHKIVRECVIYTFMQSIIGGGETDQFAHCRHVFVQLQLERAIRIKGGEPDGVLPRKEKSLEQAKEQLEVCRDIHPDYFLYHVPASVRLIQKGEYEEGSKLASLLYFIYYEFMDYHGGVLEEYVRLEQDWWYILYNVAINHFLELERSHFNLIQHILEHEDEDILCESNPDLGRLMVDLGLIEQFTRPMWVHARNTRIALLQFIEDGDQEIAIKFCKRYLSIQKCYKMDLFGHARSALYKWYSGADLTKPINLRDVVRECRQIMSQQETDWTDLPAKIKLTECLLEKLEQGKLQEIRDAQKIVEGSAECHPTVDSNLCAFFEDQIPGYVAEERKVERIDSSEIRFSAGNL